jgi:hypothetical protein
MLAERYQWTPDEVDAMDGEYIAELVAYINAEAVIKHKHTAKRKARSHA